MALFGIKKDTETKTKATKAAASVSSVKKPTERAAERTITDISRIIVNPRITEKATMHGALGVYAFDVVNRANKPQIMQAVRELYKVTPRKVRVVNIPSKIKRSARTGKVGIKGGGKKAYVYLKKGDSITLN